MKHVCLLFLIVGCTLPITAQIPDAVNHKPVAVVPTNLFVQDSLRFRPTQCYDPDGDPLQYTWKQISPPTTDGSFNASYLSMDGLEPTDEIQRMTYELTVYDGELYSDPVTFNIVVVPDYENQRLTSKSGYFDPNKPTVLAFGSGNGEKSTAWVPPLEGPWLFEANWFSNATEPPYSRVADYILTQLAILAPDYHMPIQTLGFSTGSIPAVEVAKRLNLVYGDTRYMVNRVTFCDAVGGTKPMTQDLMDLSYTSIDGETCWIDNYSVGSLPVFIHVYFPEGEHPDPMYWYQDSYNPVHWPAGLYNDGITAGYYLSVIGPAKNLYIPPILSDANRAYYFFKKELGDDQILEMYAPDRFPGHLPEPVTLIGPTLDPNGILLTCLPSAHAIRYELLVGADPYHVAHYDQVYEANEPPVMPLKPEELPYRPAWGTIRVRNAYDATIHADPVLLSE